MNIKDEVVFITGANRGIGRAFARAALERGAAKVYATARDPAKLDIPGVVPVRLDVTRPDEAQAAARLCEDVSIVINNAGIAVPGGLFKPGDVDSLRAHLETNLFGMLHVSQAFAPILAANGGGALINVISAVSWANVPSLGNYATSKAAAWGLTNSIREELRAQGTQVLAVHMGFVNTELAHGFNVPKIEPEDVVAHTFTALAGGQTEVMADAISRQIKQSLSAPDAAYLRAIGS